MPRTAKDAGQVKLGFPDKGIDTSVPFDRQPADTCVVGVNVRWQDPILHRQRGGSRPGLEKWIDEQPGGATPVQMLGVVVYYDAAALLTQAEQDGLLNSPGGLVTDTMSSNFPDGPGPTGPGGNPQGGPTGQPGFNRRTPATPARKRPAKGSGVVPNRGVTATPPPPPPPPPGTLTRTFTPYVSVYNTEHVGKFHIGPVTTPLTPPTDLSGDTAANDFFGASWNLDLSAWAGTTLPTLAQINALFVAGGWADAGTPSGPYEIAVDS